MTDQGAKAIVSLLVSILLFYLIFKYQESESYTKYVLIDKCIYLETYHVEGYSSSKTKTLVGCDEDTRMKFSKKVKYDL